MEVELTHKTQTYTGLSLLVDFGALLSGIYVGYSHSQGVAIEHKNLFIFGPWVTNMALGFAYGGEIRKSNKTLESIASENKNPYMTHLESKELARKLAPLSGGIAFTGVAMAFSGAGYVIGSYLGKHN